MKQKIFTIYDSKAKAYITPFFLHQEGMAIRIFTDCVNDPKHQFGKHPEDYILFHIGEWEDEKAKFQPNIPIALVTGIELVEQKDQKELNFTGDEVIYPELSELRKGDEGYEEEIAILKGNKA